MNNVIKYFTSQTDEWVRALIDINFDIEKAFETNILTIVSKDLFETWYGVQEFHRIYCSSRNKDLFDKNFIIVLYGSKVIGIFISTEERTHTTFWGTVEKSPRDKLNNTIIQSSLMKYIYNDDRWNKFKLTLEG